MANRLLSLLATCLTFLVFVTAAPRHRLSGDFLGLPISNPDAKDLIADRYIVVYNSTFGDAAIDTHQASIMGKIAKRNIGKRSLDGRALSTKVNTFQMGKWRAMALEADDRMITEMFSADEVAYIEQDARISLNALASQGDAPSGLARLSHASAGQSGYVFDTTAGEGITAFVVDTGIRVSHSEYQGRATFAANFVNNVVCLLFPIYLLERYMLMVIRFVGHR